MTDRPKPKPISHKTLNESRKNGKRPKGDSPHTRSTRLTGIQKVLLGKGAFLTFNGVGSDPSTQTNGKRA